MKIEKTFKNKKIRVLIKNGDPFFSAIDVCKILDIKNVSQALSYLDRDDIISSEVIDSLGRKQIASFLNEGSLYQLIFKSRKKESKIFKKWVTHEVLPSIRKTGKYSIPDSLQNKSKKNRNVLTDEWKKHGINNPSEYARLTIQEYKNLNFKNDKRKKDFDRGELLLLSALESMEALNLFYDDSINGFNDCSISLENTAQKVNKIKSSSKKIIENE